MSGEVRGGCRSPSHVGPPPLVKETWIWLRGWYRETKDLPPPPALMVIVRMTEEMVDLYLRFPLTGRSIPVALDPFPVDDLIPEDKEVAGLVHHLRLNRSTRPSSMKAGYLRA